MCWMADEGVYVVCQLSMSTMVICILDILDTLHTLHKACTSWTTEHMIHARQQSSARILSLALTHAHNIPLIHGTLPCLAIVASHSSGLLRACQKCAVHRC